MTPVRISDEGLTELRAIANHIAQNNKVRAASFAAELLERCLALRGHSERYPIIGELAGYPVRKAPYRNYVIFYTVTTEEVRILHIVHSARDYMRLLFPDD